MWSVHHTLVWSVYSTGARLVCELLTPNVIDITLVFNHFWAPICYNTSSARSKHAERVGPPHIRSILAVPRLRSGRHNPSSSGN